MTLQSLIARVDRAKGPDRALDHDLGSFLGLPTRRVARGEAPRLCYTRGVEQAEWLIAKALPDWDWSVNSTKKAGDYYAMLWSPTGDDFDERGNTPALALIRTVLQVVAEGFHVLEAPSPAQASGSQKTESDHG